MEVANTQSQSSLDTKIYQWAQGSRSHLKFIVTFQLERSSSGSRVIASVIKLRKQGRPTLQDPQQYIMVKENLIDRIEIWPTMSSITFTIHRTDVLPKGTVDHPTTSANPVTVSLNDFTASAMAAVNHLNTQTGMSSPRSSHQGSVSPPHSEPGSESKSEASNNEDPKDRSYKGKAVDRGDSRGVGTRQSSNRMA